MGSLTRSLITQLHLKIKKRKKNNYWGHYKTASGKNWMILSAERSIWNLSIYPNTALLLSCWAAVLFLAKFAWFYLPTADSPREARAILTAWLSSLPAPDKTKNWPFISVNTSLSRTSRFPQCCLLKPYSFVCFLLSSHEFIFVAKCHISMNPLYGFHIITIMLSLHFSCALARGIL